jgi:hypothetical protein
MGGSRQQSDEDHATTFEDLVKGWESHDPPSPDANKRLQTAGMMVASSIAVILGFTAPFVFVRSPLPYMATPGPKIREALVYLGKAHDRSRNTFLDLGSGDGEAVYQAARLGYRAIGLELNFTMWAFSNMRRLIFWTREEKANSQILWKNFFEYDIGHANTVMIFGVTPLMKPLSAKIAKECKVGTDVLSYRFGLPLKHPKRPETSELLQAKIVYDRQEMRIYRYEKQL